jgi:nitroimidazol reductase NimA-like FMN-containing flavoprotein (pyridoxamine 5'-phosphate oxidase superfamily)
MRAGEVEPRGFSPHHFQITADFRPATAAATSLTQQAEEPTVKTNDAVTIRELTSEEMHEILARNHVGRIAYSFHDRVDIRPIHYVYSDNWVFGRTSQSDKLEVLRHNQWVAFEVDEVQGPFDWMSVVAHGSFYRLSDETKPQNVELRDEALKLIRSFAPSTLRDTDPVPFRTELFAIALDKLTGRAATSG